MVKGKLGEFEVSLQCVQGEFFFSLKRGEKGDCSWKTANKSEGPIKPSRQA